MSLEVFQDILDELGIWLSKGEKNRTYKDLLVRFGLVGVNDECEALAKAWRSPEYREAIKKYLKRKKKKKLVIEG